MDKLINKAIACISEGKTEYAIGLLEGVLAMLPPIKEIEVQPKFSLGSVNAPTHPASIITGQAPIEDEMAIALERVVGSKLEDVKRMAGEQA